MPSSLNRRVLEDTTVDGLFFPKNSIVLANIYYMSKSTNLSLILQVWLVLYHKQNYRLHLKFVFNILKFCNSFKKYLIRAKIIVILICFYFITFRSIQICILLCWKPSGHIICLNWVFMDSFKEIYETGK